MRRNLARGTVALCLLVAASPVPGQQPVPPAPRSGHVDVYHGVEVADPYRWMEELESERTRRWVRAQDERARAFVAGPLRDRLRERMAGIADVRRYTAVSRRGGRYFYSRLGGSGFTGAAVLVREEIDGPERTLIDTAERGADAALGRASPSRTGRFLAYAVVRDGSRWAPLRVLDVDTGTPLDEAIEGFNTSVSSLSWNGDDGFFYERFDPPAPGEERRARLAGERILYHRLGTDPARDRVVYRVPPDTGDLSLASSLSWDGRFLVVSERDGATNHDRVLVMDRERGGAPVPLVDRADASYAFVGSDGPVLWLRTDLDAPNGRIIAIDTRRPGREHWTELVPEMDEAISNWVGATVIGGRIVIGYLRDALLAVKVFDADGGFRYEVELPWPGSLWSGIMGRPDSPEAFYQLSGLVDPGSIFRLDIRSGESSPFLPSGTAYDPADYHTRQVFYSADDGTRIPMFLVERKDRAPGPAPTLMYGYGFAGWAASPWFQPHMVPWLDMGGVWALPNIRGGGEYGDAWRQAGARENMESSLTDYIDATQWLIDNGVTTPGLMVANTSSAGGPVGAGAILRRPDLYGAAILDFPLLDLLRYDQFTVARAWRSDYGSSSDPSQFPVLRRLSPVHNVRDERCYPATLVTPGENDQVTPPFHAYKLVAALQHAQTCDAPVLLRVSWGAGHAYGATTEQSIDNWADQLAFLVGVLSWEPAMLGER